MVVLVLNNKQVKHCKTKEFITLNSRFQKLLATCLGRYFPNINCPVAFGHTIADSKNQLIAVNINDSTNANILLKLEAAKVLVERYLRYNR
jgi:hypothetical protein